MMLPSRHTDTHSIFHHIKCVCILYLYKYVLNRSIILSECFIFFLNGGAITMYANFGCAILVVDAAVCAPLALFVENQNFIVLFEIIFCGYHIYKHTTKVNSRVVVNESERSRKK